jgi:hypothetical protein
MISIENIDAAGPGPRTAHAPSSSRASRSDRRLVTIGVISVAVFGCAATEPALRVDLQAYVQRTKSWAPAEAETARTLDRILQTQFVDEAEVLRQIAESRPRAISHLQNARAFVPRSDPVQRIHERYIEAWEMLLRGYDAIEEGFATGDFTSLARGRQAIAAWREGIVGVARDLRELVQRFGIETQDAIES